MNVSMTFWNASKVAFYEWLHLYRDISEKTKQNYRSSLNSFFDNNVVQKSNNFRKLKMKYKESRGLRNYLTSVRMRISKT
jgi:site-specific recombinase XerC